MSELLLEEFEVLESIYPTELQKLSDTELEIKAEADEIPDGADNIELTLAVHYTPGYPDELPELALKYDDAKVSEQDEKKLLTGLLKVGTENLGMAMTFTLVSHLREEIGLLIREKIELEKKIEAEKERIAFEEEERRTRGTPVTLESFKAWKIRFDKEATMKKIQEEEEKLKVLSPKEREEWKRASTRLTGRQLFERNKHLEDETQDEDGAVSVDFSQYERTKEDEKEDDSLTFSDSD